MPSFLSGVPIWLLLAVLAAAGYFGYRWYKARQASKSSSESYTNVFPNTALDFTERDNPKSGGKG